MKISVIIATYNTGSYIKECLDSVFHQTIDDIEVIVIDDGSTDNTESILQDYIRIKNNLVLIKQDNRGAGIARNRGIDIAQGDYMAFMDPDDYYPAADCLERMYGSLQQSKTSLCGGGIIMLDGDAERPQYSAGDGIADRKKNTVVQSSEYHYLYGHTRFLYNSDIIKKEGVRFAPYRRFEDQVFTMKAIGLMGCFYELDYPVYKYRVNHKVVRFDEDMYYDMIRGIRDTLEIMCTYDMKDMFLYNCQDLLNAYLPKIQRYLFCGFSKWDELIDQINRIIIHSGWSDTSEVISYDRVEEERKNIIETKEKIDEIMASKKTIVIYGAGDYTRKLIREYKDSLEGVIGIAVNNKNSNPNSIEGFNVDNIEYYTKFKDTVHLIVPIKGIKGKEIAKQLYEQGFKYCDWLNLNWLD